MAVAHLNLGSYVFAFVSLSLAVLAPSVQAHIAAFDEYWTQRQTDAMRRTLEAYDPNPLNVTDHFNYHAALAMEETGMVNGTRRDLRQVGSGRKIMKRGGRYQSLNAIDKCWRGDKNWDKNRKKLADCALGFGRKTTGGKAGEFYTVTDASDNDLLEPKPGTLRYAVTRDRPLWIIFAKSMIIKLQQELIVTHDKTIDGRGANIHITGGAGFTLQFVKNVIIHNIHIKNIGRGLGGMIRDSETHFGLRTKSDGDGINIFGSSNIWIDHVSMTHCSDGMIDAIMGSTAITISNSHFTDHDEIALGGRYSRDFFNRHGDLRHIRRLRFWPMKKVLTEKYEFSEQDANDLSDFLVTILDFVPEKRPTASQCLLHPWINSGPRSLQPSLSLKEKKSEDKLDTGEKKRENEEQEAVEAKMGNVDISSSDSKPGTSQSSSPKQAI